MEGIPRVPWQAKGVFDGISEFKLDSHGKIYVHKVDNTVLSDPPYLSLPIFGESAINFSVICRAALHAKRVIADVLMYFVNQLF